VIASSSWVSVMVSPVVAGWTAARRRLGHFYPEALWRNQWVSTNRFPVRRMVGASV
jgi:hypothetical protein